MEFYRRSLKPSIGLMTAVFATYLFFSVAFGQAATIGMVNRQANLRAGPGTSYAVNGQAAQDQLVTIIDKNPAGDWYKLTGGQWIAAFLVNVATNPPTQTLTSATPAPLAPTTTGPTAQRAANLRAGPGTTYALIGSVDAGQALDITNHNADGSWFQLANGAWIAAFLVNQPGSAGANAVVNTGALTTSPAPIATATPAPASPPLPAANGNDFVMVEKHLWDPYENGGSLDGHSVHCGLGRELIVNVLDANGNRLNGVAVQVEYGAKEIYVTGSQGKGDGVAEFVLGSGQDVKVLRDTDGREVTSDNVTGLVTNATFMPAETLIAAHYCQDAASCQHFADTFSCEGHFSWTVTFKRQR